MRFTELKISRVFVGSQTLNLIDVIPNQQHVGLTICRPSSPIKWFVVCNFLFSYCVWILDLLKDILGSSELSKNYPIYRSKIIVDINSDKVVPKEFLLRAQVVPHVDHIISLLLRPAIERLEQLQGRLRTAHRRGNTRAPHSIFPSSYFFGDSGMFKFRKHQGAPQSLEHFCF